MDRVPFLSPSQRRHGFLKLPPPFLSRPSFPHHYKSCPSPLVRPGQEPPLFPSPPPPPFLARKGMGWKSTISLLTFSDADPLHLLFPLSFGLILYGCEGLGCLPFQVLMTMVLWGLHGLFPFFPFLLFFTDKRGRDLYSHRIFPFDVVKGTQLAPFAFEGELPLFETSGGHGRFPPPSILPVDDQLQNLARFLPRRFSRHLSFFFPRGPGVGAKRSILTMVLAARGPFADD